MRKGLNRFNSLPLLNADLSFTSHNIDIDFSDSSGISIENLGHFFQGGSSGFRIEDEDNSKFDEEPDVIDNVVFPADGGKGNWIDVVVEEERCIDAKEHDGETLCTKSIWNNFDCVGDEETRPCKRI